MEMITVTAKTVEDAITQASLQLGVSSDRIQYEVVEKGSAGVLGGLFGSKPAVIRAKKIETVDDKAADFLNSVFDAMGLAVDVEVKMNEEEKEMDVNLSELRWDSDRQERTDTRFPSVSCKPCCK